MEKLNTKDITGYSWASSEGKFAGAGKGISEELERDPLSTPLKTRHLFDVEIARALRPTSLISLARDGTEDLVLYMVAGNSIGESSYYPDSKRWPIRSPKRRLIRSESLDYFDGEQ
jgi:hypothetical protein